MGANDTGLIGKSIRRKEDARFLTGTGQYTDDVVLPRQTYAVFLRSPHAHARIRSIDTKAALASPGVVAVHTGADLQGVGGLPCEKTLLSGDLVEFDATPYAGDAYFSDWPQTLANIAALKPTALVPGRGPALKGEAQVQKGLEVTRAFVSDLYASVKAGAAAGKDLKAVYRETYAALKPKYGHWVIFDHCMPFDVTRAYDEATQYRDPRIWTAERDRQMWETLES